MRGYLFPILLASLLGFSTHSLWAQKSPLLDHSVPAELPEAPRSQTGLRVELFRFSYHHTLINAQGPLNLQPTAEAQYFTGSASSQWLTSVYGKISYPRVQRADHQFYGHHIPWAGSIIPRVSKQAQAHPRVTNIIKLLEPMLF